LWNVCAHAHFLWLESSIGIDSKKRLLENTGSGATPLALEAVDRRVFFRTRDERMAEAGIILLQPIRARNHEKTPRAEREILAPAARKPLKN